MIKLDYDNYMEIQKIWAEELTRKAGFDGGVIDREAALLAILAMDRLIAMSLDPEWVLGTNDRQDLPAEAESTEIRAA